MGKMTDFLTSRHTFSFNLELKLDQGVNFSSYDFFTNLMEG